MKKLLVMLVAVAVAVGFTTSVMAQDRIEVKEKSKSHDGVTSTKTTVKDKTTGAEIKTKTVETKNTLTTKEKVKGKNIKMKSKEKETAAGIKGKVKTKIKKGALKKLSVKYVYYKQGTNYILEYTVKDKTDPELLKALGLTPEEAYIIQPGKHQINSTSPYTATQIENDFFNVVIKDLATVKTR